jgi:tellurite resistance protein
MIEGDKVLICKIVAQAILADTRITDEESDFLGKLMDRYDLDETTRKEVLARDIGEDPAVAINALRSDDAKNELIVELALAVAVDGEISSSERKLLSRVADTLGMSETDLDLMLKAAIA